MRMRIIFSLWHENPVTVLYSEIKPAHIKPQSNSKDNHLQCVHEQHRVFVSYLNSADKANPGGQPILSPWVIRWHCVTSVCETAELAVQDFHRAREHAMMLASVDDDDGDDDDSVCASGCVCSVPVWWISLSQMAGSPRDRAREHSQPAWGFGGQPPSPHQGHRQQKGRQNRERV